MTIIIAAKFNGSVYVAYDTLVSELVKGRYVESGSPTRKWRQVGDYPVCMGVSGKVDSGLFDGLQEQLAKYEHDWEGGIDRFVRVHTPDSEDRMFMSFLGLEFLFTFPQEQGIDLRRRDNYGGSRNGEINVGGIGFGYTPDVETFVKRRVNRCRDDASLVALLRNAVELAKSNAEKDPENHDGRMLRGFGLSRVTMPGLEELEFCTN